jgi:NitT/TauT family transport system substrate-binding protein
MNPSMGRLVGMSKSNGVKIGGYVGGCVLSVALVFSGTALAAGQPESGAIRMGTEPWLGYGQWTVAQDQGIFKKHGLPDVNLVNFTEDKDLNAALVSGQVDMANVASHTALAMISAGVPIKIVMLEDTSMTADAVITNDPSIQSVNDIKGKDVAYEEGTTSHILLSYALSTKGMTLKDVKPVPMPAADAGSALIAKRVPIAVTYEPYLASARKADAKTRELFAGSALPGLISDVLVVRTDYLNSHPNQISALVSSWNDALSYYKAHTSDAQALIAKNVGASMDDLKDAFNGVRYFSLAENKTDLAGSYEEKTLPIVQKAGIETGLIHRPVDPVSTIDAQFVNAAE